MMSDSCRKKSSGSNGHGMSSAEVANTFLPFPQRYRLSLIPITQTFPAEMLHSESRSSGAPTITVTEPERNVLPEENASETTGSIVLGRNPATQIAGAADFLSRRLVEIRLERDGKSTVAVSSSSSTSAPPPPSSAPPRIVVQPLKELSGILGHQLHLNGEKLELNMNRSRTAEPGDVLALFDKYFHYQIRLDKYPIVVDLSDDEVEGDDRKVAAAPAVADGAKEEDIDDEEKKIILEQSKSPGRRAKESMKLSMECPLCSEILSNTQSLSCGHVVCGECATEYGIHAFLESQEELSSKPSSSRQNIVAAPVAVGAAIAAAAPKDGAASSQSEEFHTAKEYNSQSWSGPSNMDKCPQCQKGITAIFPNFSLDSIIMGQVLSGEGEFDLYDIQVYLKKQGKARLTEGEAKSIFRKHPAYLSEYIEGLKRGEVTSVLASASAWATASATSKAATSTRKGTKINSIEKERRKEEPQKKKARSSTDEIVIDDDSDDNEQEDAKTKGNDNIAVGSNEVICIDV